jgi:hypothetical protein
MCSRSEFALFAARSIGTALPVSSEEPGLANELVTLGENLALWQSTNRPKMEQL